MRVHSSNSPPLFEPAAAVALPALTRDARGIPAAVVRGLVEAVLSAAVCCCGREVAVEAPAGGGCPAHGLTAVSWVRLFPSGVRGGRIDGNHGDAEVDEGRRRYVASGTALRRACLVETLRALSAACRCEHTREELARQCRGAGGGIAKGLALLCDALCSRVTELRRRQQGPFRRSNVAGDAYAGR